MKRIIITACLIFGLSILLSVKTNNEISREDNISKLYSGTLVDMLSPDIAPVYSMNDSYTGY